MSLALRVTLALAGLIAAVTAVRVLAAGTVLMLLLVVVGAHIVVARSVRAVVRRFAPVLAFAAIASLLQMASGNPRPVLGLHVLFVFACAWLLGLIVTGGSVSIPTSRYAFRLYLYLHFVRHFSAILGAETRRMLIARRIAAPNLFAADGFRSLVHALASVFQRSLTRAERFYAAQWLKGLDA